MVPLHIGVQHVAKVEELGYEALMIKTWRFLFVVLMISSQMVSMPSDASAGATIDAEFERLKDLGENYEISGVVCEQIARLDYEIEFPAPAYEVVSGISYGDEDGTLGELDVVVFETKSGRAIKLTEVKCWQDKAAALKEARVQQARFRIAVKNAISGQRPLFFKSAKSDAREYAQELFHYVKSFETVSSLGSKIDGFDREIPYSRSELSELRSKLLQCQASGDCKKH